MGIVHSAAREAARHAAVHGITDPGVHARAAEVLRLTIPDNANFTLDLTKNGDTVTAVVTQPYNPFIDLSAIGAMMGFQSQQDVNVLMGTAYFRNENPD